jgi:anaerobic selenocysteine-containing dehydrogenase
VTQMIQLAVNGKHYEFTVEPWTTLLEVLRDNLKLTRTKEGCSVGECGACAVVMDGKTVHSCLVLAVEASGKEIVTSEGLSKEAELYPVQEAFVDHAAIQCGSYHSGAGTRQEFLSFCHICAGHCSIKVTVEDGRVIDIAPDMESGLSNELCPIKKGRLSIPEILVHPDRLKYPLKRVGAKGKNKWQRISWDEALDTIAERLSYFKEKYGPESVALGLGEPKGLEFAFAQRFASVFGTPNVVTPGWCCGTPGTLGCNFTIGSGCVPDGEHSPALIVLWGNNIIHTTGGIRRETISSNLESGTKLVVIDPRKIDMASLADLWIRVRPGSDGALAMGLLKVIIEEKLYDKDFVDKWTIGFEQLQEHVKSFSLQDVERVTWVPKEQIEQVARLYAQTKPATIQWGNALDQGANSFQTFRVISIIMAITGNLNVPGGNVFLTPPPYTRPGRFFLLSKFPRKPESTAGGEFKLAIRSAFIPSSALLKAILEEKPHPVKAGLFILTDPLISYPDSEETYKALMKLEFMVVFEIFMTPTAALADIVLPVATGMEHDEIGYWPGWYEEVRAHHKVVDPPGEAWPDTKIVNELAKRLGMKEYFWDDDSEALNFWLQPSGLSFEDLKQRKTLLPKMEYKAHEFRTPSGKVEIYSKQLAELGYSPMPLWQELSQLPELPEEYPLLLTNAKEDAYMLTGYKMIASLRNMKPEPTVELNPTTAEKAGLKDGDMVYIETKRGRIMQRLCLNPDLDPRVVLAAFGWWFPEEGPSNLYGWRKSNINVLVENRPPYDPTTGSAQLRGIPCRVYKA